MKMQIGDILLLPAERTPIYADIVSIVDESLKKIVKKHISINIKWLVGILPFSIDNILDSLEIGEKVAEFLKEKTGNSYLHAGIYLDKGYGLEAWFNGVKLVKYTPKAIASFHVFRHKEFNLEQHGPKVLEKAKEYFNRSYDFASLIINSLAEISNLFWHSEKKIEKLFKSYNTENAVICSELVARIYEEIGLPITENPEFTSPGDIAQSDKVTRII